MTELDRVDNLEKFDERRFIKLFNSMKPLINRLAFNIDERRFNVSKDIIVSYFHDKFIYVYNKYHLEYDDERLKATMITSLNTFKNRLLRKAYGEEAEYNQSLSSLDVLYDNNKEDKILDEEDDIKKIMWAKLSNYLKDKLSPDAYLLFQVELDPPPYLRVRMKHEDSKFSIIQILDFFELPRTKSNSNFISGLRSDINFWIERAKIDLNKKARV